MKAPTFQRAAPSHGAQQDVLIDDVRGNLLALVGAVLIGTTLPGWAMATSLARGEANPGTADQPARWYFTAGSGQTTYWVKLVPTWDATTGAIAKIAFYWSDENERTGYLPLADDAGNYVLSLAYDADLNLVSAAWGKV